ncbi:cytoplasmic dynein 2 intermediate chain 2-like [Maniola hyperantus]|uniref:cytoplasmic dynein 2 intermediate chain 2-like n=1 Tax=Aphantopus hyperantus TaxID=2795564 RepID=UPI001568A8A3|nr:uncharacterized protein LOC117994382 [Maniola hyperantus]
MSNLTGFDSEAVGFDCVTQDSRQSVNSCSQTTEFSASGAGSQTSTSKDIGCMVHPDDLSVGEDVLKEYPPPGLNEFLRRVVPGVMQQLQHNDRELLDNSSDSDEEEVLTAKLLQEIQVKPDGSGDHQASVLGVTWSSSGNSVAVSVGQAQHDAWCHHTGVIRVYTHKRSEDRFVHTIDITEKNCVTVLQYHPSVAALLAYGTTSGEVVLCNLRNGALDEGTQLASPGGCHGARRVSALRWADAPLADAFLTMQISSQSKRRGASDQVLISAGADGSLVAWQANASSQVFESIVSYAVDGTRGSPPDITCFDFIKSCPLRPLAEKTPDDVFVVGSKTGKLLLCKIRPPHSLSEVLDPVYDVLEGHDTCVLDVAFNSQRPGVFVSVSMDSELRVYDIAQGTPLKVLCLAAPVSCMCWLWPPCVAVGLHSAEELLRVYNVCGGRALPVAGLSGCAIVTCVAVCHSGSCRIAAGDECGTVRVWELPSHRIKLSALDLDF